MSVELIEQVAGGFIYTGGRVSSHRSVIGDLHDYVTSGWSRLLMVSCTRMEYIFVSTTK